ncbi:MAG: HIT domain-containing protein, partial [Gammaproteobacteria bacterium]|nr:HIT domain-containing protein [Gammaproteobacteria bacterium]
MINDSQTLWRILVPERENLKEIHQLYGEDQLLLIRESCYVAEKLADHFKVDKMNIAALGNLVPQLHSHHVVRYQKDKALPAPIWGKFAALPYTEKKFKHKSQSANRAAFYLNKPLLLKPFIGHPLFWLNTDSRQIRLRMYRYNKGTKLLYS